MNVCAALVGGFAGTLMLTATLAAFSHLRLTRMDIPFLLGTAFTQDRSRARVVGYALHFVAGLVFALVYYAVFTALGRAGWQLGMLFGLVHALFAGTALVCENCAVRDRYVSLVPPALHVDQSKLSRCR